MKMDVKEKNTEHVYFRALGTGKMKWRDIEKNHAMCGSIRGRVLRSGIRPG